MKTAWTSLLLACVWFLLRVPAAGSTSRSYMSDDDAERTVFSGATDDSVVSRVAAAGLKLSSVLRYDAVEASLRQAGLLEPADKWLKPNKPMLLQGWWDSNGRATQRGLLPTGSNASDPLTQLVRLFILRRTVPLDIVRSAVGGNDTLAVLLDLGVLYPTPVESTSGQQLLASSVQLFPLPGPLANQLTPSEPRDVLVATDWHRRRPLSEALSAVMTIGSDSQALAGWLRSASCPSSTGRTVQVLDLCTGSGVQAMVLGRRCPAAELTLVDKSSRALRFARFNLLLNGISSDRVTLVVSDLYASLPPRLKHKTGGTFDLIVANPPFVPNPPLNFVEQEDRSTADRRLGDVNDSFPSAADALFADGGERGVGVIQRIVAGATDWLREGGELRMVTSLTVPPSNGFSVDAAAWRSDAWHGRHPAVDVSAAVVATAIGLEHKSGWRGQVGWRTVLGTDEYARYYEGGAGVLAERYAAGLRRVGVAAVVVDAMIRLEQAQGHDSNELIVGHVHVGQIDIEEVDYDDDEAEEDEDDEQVDEKEEESDESDESDESGEESEEESEEEESDDGGDRIPTPTLLWELVASGRWDATKLATGLAEARRGVSVAATCESVSGKDAK